MNMSATNTPILNKQVKDNVVVLKEHKSVDNFKILRAEFMQLQAAYEESVDMLDHANSRNDQLEAELWGKTLELENMHKRLEKLTDEHIWLSVANELLEEKRSKKLIKSKRLGDIQEQLHSKFLVIQEFLTKAVAPQLARLTQLLVSIKNAAQKKTSDTAETTEVKPEARWFNLNRAMPAYTGMYRVSDGKTSTLAYFDSGSAQFASQGLGVKFWSPVK